MTGGAHLRVVRRQREDLLETVGIPILDHLVLAAREEIVGLADERNRHDALRMGMHRAVAVAEVKSPNLDGLVSTARDEERACVTCGHGT